MPQLSDWLPASPFGALELPLGEVHVWRTRLDPPPPQVARLSHLLVPAEHERAGRFYFDRDRRRFVVSRGYVKQLLGSYQNLSPLNIRFFKGPYDKPYLSAALGRGPFQFNVSHSQEMALFAFTRHGEVGVDVEFHKKLDEIAEIATHFFSPREVADLLGLPPELQRLGFFNCWSRKEAYIKAIGKGLSQPLDSFDVSLRPGAEPRLRTVVGQPDEVARWRMVALDVAPDYAGALVYEGDQTVRLFDIS